MTAVNSLPSNESHPTDSADFDAELVGLPMPSERDHDPSRDPVEMAVTAFLEELRQGQRPSVESFARRNPAHADRIREMLPLVAAMESWKANRELTGARQTSNTKQFDRLGDCRIVREIGRGGMGVVYEAVREPDNHRVAVKVLPWRFPESSPWRMRFEREAQMTARLRHPHIVRVYGFGQQEGWCYYIMHLVEGVSLDRVIRLLREPAGIVVAEKLHAGTEEGDLSRVLRRGSWGQIAKIGIQSAAALKYAHAQGTLHRDIKPANLLLDRHGAVWLADFGMATQTNALQETEPHCFGGTLSYLAPEQLEGRADARSDIYSLGVTMYELCTLQPAYSAKDRTSLLEQVRTTSPLRPRSLNPDIPADLERIILKAMARDPEKRFATADQLDSALRLFAKHSSIDTPSNGWLNLLGRFISGGQ